MIKKFLTIAMLLIMTFALMSSTVLAEGELSLTATSVTAKPGDIVSVNIEVSNNPGAASLSCYIDYDSNLEYIESETTFGSIYPADNSSVAVQSATQLYYMTYTTKNVTNNGLLATLKFKVADNAAAGQYSIVITPDPDPNFGCMDEDYNVLAAVGGTAYVTVEADEPVVETKAVGFVASVANYTSDMKGVAFTVTSNKDGVLPVVPQVAFNKDTIVESASTAVKIGLQVTDVPEDVELTVDAEIYY